MGWPTALPSRSISTPAPPAYRRSDAPSAELRAGAACSRRSCSRIRRRRRRRTVVVEQQALPAPRCRSCGRWARPGTTYVIAEGPAGLYLIDQHAAHERVLFEQFLPPRWQQPGGCSRCWRRCALELTPEQQYLVTVYATALREHGFEIEPFGPGGYLLRTAPGGPASRRPGARLRRAARPPDARRCAGRPPRPRRRFARLPCRCARRPDPRAGGDA